MKMIYHRKPNRPKPNEGPPAPTPVARTPWARSEMLPSTVIVCHSPHDRCGVREYGRQLDEALGRHVRVAPFTHQDTDALVNAASPGTLVLVHYEATLVTPGFAGILHAIKTRRARVVFCCHIYSPQVSLWSEMGLVDAVVLHRPYSDPMPYGAIQIPLGCPAYEPNVSREELRARLRISPESIALTTVGFLAQWKQLPRTVDAVLSTASQDPRFIFQVQTPCPFAGASGEEAEMRSVIARYGHAADRIRFSTTFLPEHDLLDLVHASDVGFVFHGQHTMSVSAATKQFVSARCPLVITDSTHSSDVHGGSIRTGGFDPGAFAREVARVASDASLRDRLRAEMTQEYARLNMNSVAGQYLELFRSIGP